MLRLTKLQRKGRYSKVGVDYLLLQVGRVPSRSIVGADESVALDCHLIFKYPFYFLTLNSSERSIRAL